MTNETMLAKLNELTRYTDNSELIKAKLENLIDAVKADIYAKGWMSAGKHTEYNAAKRIALAGQKLGYVGWYHAEEYVHDKMATVTYVGDTYRFMRFDEKLELPKSEDSSLRHIDYSRLAPNPNYNDEVYIPFAENVRSAIKIYKAEHDGRSKKTTLMWALKTSGGNTVYVNANYLLDQLEALPNTQCYTYTYNLNLGLYGLYFEDDIRFGILLPIRPNNDVNYFLLNDSARGTIPE